MDDDDAANQPCCNMLQKGATIGANATIVCGAKIGKYSFVGAGAVVTKNVPDHALVTGNPAKQTGWMCRCGERLSDNLECDFCKNKYQLEGNVPMEVFTM